MFKAKFQWQPQERRYSNIMMVCVEIWHCQHHVGPLCSKRLDEVLDQ